MVLHIIKNNIYMLKYAWKYARYNIFQRIIFSLFSIIPSLVNVLIVKEIIDELTNNGDWLAILECVLLGCITSIIMSFINSYVTNIGNEKAKLLIQKNMQTELMIKARNIDLYSYDDPEFYNKYSLALAEAEDRVIQILDTCTRILSDLLNIITLITIIAYITPIMLCFSIILVIIELIIGNKKSNTKYKYRQKNIELDRKKKYYKKIFYDKNHATELRINDVSALIIKKFENIVKKSIQLCVSNGKTITKYDNLINFLTWINSFSMMFFLGILSLKRKITIGDFSAMFNATQQLTHNLLSLVGQLQMFYQHSLFIDDFVDVLQYQSIIENSKEVNKHVKKDFHKISFKSVNFSYGGGDKLSLKNINIEINKGDKIALVGMNGSGKSTIIKLLLRLYDPCSGYILIDDEPITNIDIKSYRALFGTVLQNPVVYALSVAENIILDEVKTKQDEVNIIKALKFASIEYIAHNSKGIYVDLSKEFDNSGLVLSGGEEQKIAIARAIIDDAPILIMDEASSALDPISEHKVYKKMLDMSKEKTVIMIAHKLSAICMADKIYVINNGVITETGTHQELLMKKGDYYQMWAIQSEKYQLNCDTIH